MRLFAFLLVGALCSAQATLAADPAPTPKTGQSSAKSTQVLGFQLSTAMRENTRAALKTAGAKVSREDDRYWYDLYDASALLDGADVLSVGYSLKDGRLGVLQYSFPNRMDTEAVRKIGDMVATKYGPPGKSSGNIGLGKVTYVWTLQDGVTITVFRGWPDTSVLLTYEVPTVSRLMADEQADNEKAQKESAAKGQSKNF